MFHLVGTNFTEKLRIQLKLDFLTAVVGFGVFFPYKTLQSFDQ